MTEKEHYKYGLSGDKVDVEIAERLRAKIRTLTAELAASERYRENLAQGHVDQADRIRALEAREQTAIALLRRAISRPLPEEYDEDEDSRWVADVAGWINTSQTETKGEASGGK